MHKLDPSSKDKRTALLTFVATLVAIIRLGIEVYKMIRKIQL